MQNPEKPWVRVRYYGWRIKMLSIFPNAISVKVVDKSYTHIPWFNIIFIALLAVGTIFVVRFFRVLMERLGRSERYQVIAQSVRDRTGRK